MLRVINVKKDNPNVDYALFLIDQEIKYSKAIGNKIIIIMYKTFILIINFNTRKSLVDFTLQSRLEMFHRNYMQI